MDMKRGIVKKSEEGAVSVYGSMVRDVIERKFF